MPCRSRQPPARTRATCWPPLTAAPSPMGSPLCCRVTGFMPRWAPSSLSVVRWIDTYADDEYQTIVAEVLALADDVGLTLCAAEETRARAHFATSARYEWMFWDAAWRREVWPV